MRRAHRGGALLALAALALAPAAAPAAQPSDRVAAAMLRELNRVRAGEGLPRVRLDARMARNAAAHARAMARSQLVSHGRWSERLARSSGRSTHVGEVIGWLARSAPRQEAMGLVRTWLASPVHRAVLLDGDFRRVGVGRAAGTLSGVRSSIYTIDFAAAR